MSDWESDSECCDTVPTNYEHNNQNGRCKSRSLNTYTNRKDNGKRPQHGRNGRGGGRGGYSGRNYEHNETIDVRSDCIGKIIGKGGSNIQRLQSDYNVRVNLDKDSGTVTVSGNNDRDVKSALDNIKAQMNNSEGGRRRSDRGYEGDGNGHNNDETGGSGNNPPNYIDSYNGYSKENSKANNDDDLYTADGLINWDVVKKRSEEFEREHWAKCPALTKNFYQESPEVTKLSSEEVERIRFENNNITVSRVFKSQDGASDDIPNPIWKFEQCFGSYPDIMNEISKQEFQQPSPIQAQGWPILLKGEDMIGIAQTGTGKTLAFLFPAFIHTEYQSIPRSQRGGPNVLILAPTRELALQIEKEVNKYQFRGMKAVCIYGGGSRKEQIGVVERGVDIIICTPGRLNDLVKAKVIDLSSITYLVLDEADRMLDMGFEPQIRIILQYIRPDRQTVMTSATWPAGVRRLAEKYMNNPIQVCVGSLDLAATHTVKQIVKIVEEDDKFSLITDFIKEMKPDEKVIIFCSRRLTVTHLASDLNCNDYMCESIHGSREQDDREQAIKDITSGAIKILVATDVASRGLDIEDITHVINYDFPLNMEEYVHRVGRTGRAGRTGTSISFLTRSDWAMAPELISILEEANQEVPNELRDMADRFEKVKERKRDEMSKYKSIRGQRSGGGGGYRNRYHAFE